MRLSRGKGIVHDVGSVNVATRAEGVTEGLAYPSSSFSMPKVRTLHGLVPETCLPPPFLIIPSLIVTQGKANLTTLFSQALTGQSFGEQIK